jgi:hypothetical protein
MIEVKVAAGPDALVKQETNVQPQRVTLTDAQTAAWQSGFQKTERIIT